MKKSNLICGIVYFLSGIIFLMAALLTDTKLDSIFCGLSGAGIVSGLIMIYKYFYWSSPRHKQEYKEILELEKIELHDELKESLREKSGRIAYISGLITTSVAILVFSVLESLEYAINYRIVVLYLGGYLVFQALIAVIIYNHLQKKYE